mgnify:CR=1 FL=1
MNTVQIRGRAAAKAAGFDPKWRHPDADETTGPVKFKRARGASKKGRKGRGRK